MKTDRVSLRADDALLAMCELRFAIERDDARITEMTVEDEDDSDHYFTMVKYRSDNWQAYQRIAKALGLKPTLSAKAVSE